MDNFGDNFSENARLFQIVKAFEEEKRLLKKRSIIETVIGKFKTSSARPHLAFALLKLLSLVFVPVFLPLISLFHFAIRVLSHF
jgi:hypothetical protein